MNKVYRRDNYELKQVSSILNIEKSTLLRSKAYDILFKMKSILELLNVYNCIFMSWSINQFMFLPHAGKR